MLKPQNLSVSQRRRARRLAVWNGAVWAIGNGLASTTLVIYLAKELHAERLGLGISLIVAAPQIAGLLRLGAPALIDRLGNRKHFCIATFLLGAMLLLVLPWVCAPGRLPSPGWSLAALILLWCLYHLLQYLGMVGLWSWLADVADVRIRGRFLGWRERWLVAGQAAAAIIAGLFVWGVLQIDPKMPAWIPYAVAGGFGAGFMILSLAPLLLMPSAEATAPNTKPRPVVASRPQDATTGRGFMSNAPRLLAPFRDARFLRLLAFGCWFSFFNGVTQSAQNYYPMQVLGVSLFLSLTLQTGMRFGQLTVSPGLGALADRLGNRPVMIVSQLLVAAGLLFFAAATPEHWAWFIGAWVIWIAYAGLNVCLPNLLLKLSPERSNSPYIAAFYAVTGLCYAASTIVGGALVDSYKSEAFALGNVSLGFFPCLFLFGWAARSLGAIILLLVIEPAGRSVAASRNARFSNLRT
jgi:MFS family permease